MVCFIFGRFQEILKCLFQNREGIRQEYLKLEMLLRENELKSFYQQQCHKQIEMLCSEDRVEKVLHHFMSKLRRTWKSNSWNLISTIFYSTISEKYWNAVRTRGNSKKQTLVSCGSLGTEAACAVVGDTFQLRPRGEYLLLFRKQYVITNLDRHFYKILTNF